MASAPNTSPSTIRGTAITEAYPRAMAAARQGAKSGSVAMSCWIVRPRGADGRAHRAVAERDVAPGDVHRPGTPRRTRPGDGPHLLASSCSAKPTQHMRYPATSTITRQSPPAAPPRPPRGRGPGCRVLSARWARSSLSSCSPARLHLPAPPSRARPAPPSSRRRARQDGRLDREDAELTPRRTRTPGGRSARPRAPRARPPPPPDRARRTTRPR